VFSLFLQPLLDPNAANRNPKTKPLTLNRIALTDVPDGDFQGERSGSRCTGGGVNVRSQMDTGRMVDPIGVSLRLSAAASEISGLVGLRNPSREPMTTSRPQRPNARAVAMACRHLECRRHKYINEYKQQSVATTGRHVMRPSSHLLSTDNRRKTRWEDSITKWTGLRGSL